MNLFFHILVYNTVLSVYLYATLALDPRMWLHRMPPEVVAKVPPKTDTERRRLIPLGIPFLIVMAGYPLWYTAAHNSGGYGEIAGLLFLFFLSFDIFDTFILDLLIFCKITPSCIVIEGTDAGDYKNRKYHLQSGLKGFIILIIGALVLGGILYLTLGH